MSRYWARGKFWEHERGVRVARGAAECNSSLLSALTHELIVNSGLLKIITEAVAGFWAKGGAIIQDYDNNNERPSFSVNGVETTQKEDVWLANKQATVYFGLLIWFLWQHGFSCRWLDQASLRVRHAQMLVWMTTVAWETTMIGKFVQLWSAQMEAKWIAFRAFAILKRPGQNFLLFKSSDSRKQMIEKYNILSVIDWIWN